MDERLAIQRLKHRNISGLEWLVNQFHQEAIRVAYLITGDPQAAEDVVQESFLIAYNKIDYFDTERPFRPWFMRCVSNMAVRKSQKMAHQVSLETGAEDARMVDLLEASGKTVEEMVEASELVGELQKAIYQLSPRQREAVIQRYFLNLNEKEMTLKMKSAPGTIKWLLSEARKSLRAFLRAESE